MTDETRSVLYLFGGAVVGTAAATLILSALGMIGMVRNTRLEKAEGRALKRLIVITLAFALFVFVVLTAQTLKVFWEVAR
jgi:hypothetical protein